MTGKTKKQILQELEESQKRIQELQQEADRLKNYSFIHESDQKLIHNLRLQAEGHKYAINLLREKNIKCRGANLRSSSYKLFSIWTEQEASGSFSYPHSFPFLPRSARTMSEVSYISNSNSLRCFA